MNRAERRHRTQRKHLQRKRQWADVNRPREEYSIMGMRFPWEPSARTIGSWATMSPFDCGNSGCFCAHETGPHIERQAARKDAVQGELAIVDRFTAQYPSIDTDEEWTHA